VYWLHGAGCGGRGHVLGRRGRSAQGGDGVSKVEERTLVVVVVVVEQVGLTLNPFGVRLEEYA